MQINKVSTNNTTKNFNNINFKARVEVAIGSEFIDYLKSLQPTTAATNAYMMTRVINLLKKVAPNIGNDSDVIRLGGSVKGLERQDMPMYLDLKFNGASEDRFCTGCAHDSYAYDVNASAIGGLMRRHPGNQSRLTAEEKYIQGYPYFNEIPGRTDAVEQYYQFHPEKGRQTVKLEDMFAELMALNTLA